MVRKWGNTERVYKDSEIGKPREINRMKMYGLL